MTPDETVPDHWPDPDPDQIRVMILGTYHMDNPGLDTVNVEADDVLEPDRQSEIERLVDLLEPWEPEHVAVERPYSHHEGLNDIYERYRSGEYEYGREEHIDPPHPERDDATTECRSEVIQVGFRLADRCGHDEVYPIDVPTGLGNEDIAALEERGFEPESKTDVELVDHEAKEREENDRLATSTIVEYLREDNREAELRFNHEGMFGEYMRWGEDDNFGGPDALATWYRRNLRMVHNVWRAVEPGDDRVFLLVGSGHVRVLRYLFDEMPQFAPVSPLPYLDGS